MSVVFVMVDLLEHRSPGIDRRSKGPCSVPGGWTDGCHRRPVEGLRSRHPCLGVGFDLASAWGRNVMEGAMMIASDPALVLNPVVKGDGRCDDVVHPIQKPLRWLTPRTTRHEGQAYR